MNDHIDEMWFGRKQSIHKTDPETGHIVFTSSKKWRYYVDSRRLEITCGEAPYLVSRYDVPTGDAIPLEKRIGILDRKLRAVTENATTEEEWVKWAMRAYEATYGHEFQGDNLLIARVNLLMTFEEYLYDRWERKPTDKEYRRLTNIICWNIWQMDGLSGTIPYCKAKEEQMQLTLDGWMGIDTAIELKNTQPKCHINDWRRENSVELGGLSAVTKAAGEAIAKIPVISKTQLDENLIVAGERLESFGDRKVQTRMRQLVDQQSSCIRPFVENIETIGRLYSRPMALVFNGEDLYLGETAEA